MQSLTSRALALVRPTLRGNPQLAAVVPRAKALEHKVLLLGMAQNELEAAVADDAGLKYLQGCLTDKLFQRDLCRAARLTFVEVGRVRIKPKLHPADVILRGIERSYPQEVEIRVSTEIAGVIRRDEAEKFGVLLERVQGTLVTAICRDGNGEKFLRERFQQKLFRETIATTAGLPRESAAGLTLDKPRRVSAQVLENEIKKVYPERRVEDLSQREIRAQVQRVRAERTTYSVGEEQATRPRLDSVSETKNLLNTIAAEAFVKEASDLRIFYDLATRRLHYRLHIDGRWHEQPSFPIELDTFHSIINLIKQEAKIAGIEKDVPQDGDLYFKFLYKGVKIDFTGRVNLKAQTDPRYKGLDIFIVTIRLFRGSEEIRPMEQLGLLPFQMEMIERIARATDGLLLVGGPTGSGKNGTLKAITKRITGLHPWKDFVSIEDPVEQYVPFMFQVEVPRRKDKDGNPVFDPTSFMPAILRSNYQGIQMTEIRDKASAEFAFLAADTGIYTQATVHIRNPFQVISRLSKYGIRPHEIGESLIAVICQRLMPRLCQHCALENDWESVFAAYPQLQTVLDYWKIDPTHFIPRRANSSGCPKCNRGYAGRIAAFEIWQPGLQKQQLANGTDMNLIRETALLELGHWTMLRAATCHALAGLVDFDSVMSITNNIDPSYEGLQGYRYNDLGGTPNMESQAVEDRARAQSVPTKPIIVPPGAEAYIDAIDAELVDEASSF